MVWSMKRKRNPVGKIITWKVRLCAGEHKSVEGLDYWSTYSPVVSWSTLRLIITMALLQDWHMQSIDFVLAFPQAPVVLNWHLHETAEGAKQLCHPRSPFLSDRFRKINKLVKTCADLKMPEEHGSNISGKASSNEAGNNRKSTLVCLRNEE